jgi:uncharacterized protein with FMN-binding domain
MKAKQETFSIASGRNPADRRGVRYRARSVVLALLALIVLAPLVAAQDVVELTSGAKVRGKVKEIRKEKKEFDFEATVGGRTYERTYPFDRVRAVTMGGKRYELTEESAATTDEQKLRPKAAVERLIEDAGSTPPDWYESTPLDYPTSLDLSWPLKAEGDWNNQKNIGQYIWDIINPNPNRWREGLKLVHHCLSLHQSDPKLMKRDMDTLGVMYFDLFQDYARAAFWLQKAGVVKGSRNGVYLAECYLRLGNKGMAKEMLNARRVNVQAIKLWGDMGETQRAVQLAEAYRKAKQPQVAFLLAGDACRLAGRFNDAIKYYREVLDVKEGNENYVAMWNARARDSIEAIRLFEKTDPRKIADGTYTGSSIGYNGAMTIEVQVATGRIEDVRVTQHDEKQFYSALTDTTQQIIKKQSVKNIDATSGATITSQAIVNATAKALAQGSTDN